MVENPDLLQENAFRSLWETEPPSIIVDSCVLGEIPWKQPLTTCKQAVQWRGLCLSILLFHGPNSAVKQKNHQP